MYVLLMTVILYAGVAVIVFRYVRTDRSRPQPPVVPLADILEDSVQTPVNFVLAHVGDAYRLGATGPDVWDSSSLVQAAYGGLPRSVADQAKMGVPVLLDSLRPGDLLFWGRPEAAYHVAVCTTSLSYVSAESESLGVAHLDWNHSRPDFARRILPSCGQGCTVGCDTGCPNWKVTP